MWDDLHHLAHPLLLIYRQSPEYFVVALVAAIVFVLWRRVQR